MGEKMCDKCNTPYKGFGTTCAPCRKGASQGEPRTCQKCSHVFNGFGNLCHECSPALSGENKCKGCGKTAYAMERINVEGEVFHPGCFKCAHCDGKLSLGKFSKSPDHKYYCKVHFEQLFKVRGRYSLSGQAPTPADLGTEASTEATEATATEE
mmetsp:Transcript_93308/g.194719  ORF Transcript_93308/g.194719 Transcript_93308/m.194719 type:complete len:154 (+) Transcript_93308:185-646(+)|eukprot:CAMPEP_0194766454 /NCGR_PEP_ID=MMETSP0323_2-20130528/31465_1 /TAXON_ID=2866 ORGANISM="Crypthecodinium cohnii, Strain Seligo" /NCGR_SAMPLE_ID=MMETSP0323_2 /ASSEMBLY_ACC=CAM_ASM_000346 /LENGTH=153 /DNA_ID=CAMNT_0039697337 /DNA_START=87 /DNA_END=548 /DNA_ORIENTATION=+